MVSKNHRVLIFGEKVFGPRKPKLSIDYSDVELLSFPDEYDKLSRLAEYDLVIVDYSAFLVVETSPLGFTRYRKEQEIFEKQMLEALDTGSSFCILHYNERVPKQVRWNYENGYMDDEEIAECEATQIGFRWLRRFQIRPIRFGEQVINSDIRRAEFKSFLDRWGSSKNAFVPYRDGKFGDLIYSVKDEVALGFVLPVKRGKLLYLPCQRDFQRPASVEECLTTLINSTITYLTRSRAEVPSWAVSPLFTQERALSERLSDLQSEIDALQEELRPFQEAKNLAFLSEYGFEEAVPKFVTSHLGIPTYRDEKYKEDFWLLNSQSQEIVIAEAKSHTRGLKRSDIYSLHNHRESNGLDDNFPALLVVNVHLNAKSWKQKIRSIDPQDYKVAASHNILIVRIEDLLFFWNAITEGRQSLDRLLEIILHENGWLQVEINGDFVLHK